MHTPRQLKIGFIYNHEVPHQVAHTAPILKEMLVRHPHLNIDVLTSTEDQKELVCSGLGPELSRRTNFVDLDVSKIDKGIVRAANAVAPARRVLVLKHNLELLSSYDVFVVPESTSLLLKTQFGLNHLKFVLTHHGAGDRAVAQKSSIRDFDFVLVAGEKDEKRHKEHGLIRDGHYAIAGYPKFDFVPHVPANLDMFENDNPVVLYNPHFDPHLSSWYDMGVDVLDAFAKTPDINLIFAPHIMLFERKMHTSVEHKRVRLRKNLPKRFENLPNIHIDLGSARSVDMTYTRRADIYIGDVSSQIYEFLEKRRPTIFLNSHNADWAGNPFYTNWTTGPVLDSVENLIEMVRQAKETHEEYLPAQNQAFEDTFEFSGGKSSVKAADAIAEFLNQEAHSEPFVEAAQ
ncbi:CDP-glycerol:poly(glycerophosphate) glycerophosphotransferase [Litorimonas taeanensis]|uniref:CDP-glycerol:poly(Glycerophosphate) glycerophosphotransferase n=1 Tax=Litorimonas taeanensis TaxID=568099 RepID=A0A420WKL0_9PROT|nr:CDP-glycerol glycerophosphotransferase family protein [Litorimonas taeanensis]RKQ71548.1 CDP-glycerol:poly(glycerophosphate) glycerophosphotransferase [Litorimonas taeanensis]